MNSSRTGPGDGIVRARRADRPPSAPAAGIHQPRAVKAAEQIRSLDPSQSVARALATGKLSEQDAKSMLIDDAIRKVASPGLTPAQLAALRSEVGAILEDDPWLQSQLGKRS